MYESKEREQGTHLMPKFGENGLVTVVAQAADNGAVLMVAYMNAAAIAATLDTGLATFWSRSRNALWQKGETSGNTLTVLEIRIDCDQDALLLIVEPSGPACHTGTKSCFYRRIKGDALQRVMD